MDRLRYALFAVGAIAGFFVVLVIVGLLVSVAIVMPREREREREVSIVFNRWIDARERGDGPARCGLLTDRARRAAEQTIRGRHYDCADTYAAIPPWLRLEPYETTLRRAYDARLARTARVERVSGDGRRATLHYSFVAPPAVALDVAGDRLAQQPRAPRTDFRMELVDVNGQWRIDRAPEY